MKSLMILLSLVLCPAAFADNYVECNKDGKFEMAITTAAIKDYTGAVGKLWELKLGSLDRDWITVSDQISATNYVEDGKQIVDITIGTAVKYKVIDVGSNVPTLEKHITPNRPSALKFVGFECYAVNR